MLNTGFISFIIEGNEPLQDANGNTLQASKVNSDYFPCNLAVNTREYKVLVDQQWQLVKYSIIVDNYLIEDLDLSGITEIQLQDLRNNDLGIHQIQNKQYLEMTNRLKIVV